MVFHGDYEVEFEIYKSREGEVSGKLLGHMVGISAGDAKARWRGAHELSPEECCPTCALVPQEQR
jgi:hypothetical protein